MRLNIPKIAVILITLAVLGVVAAAVAIPVTFIVAQAVMLGRQAAETPQDTEQEPRTTELAGSQHARQ